jgi:hypothetical protein
VYERTTTAITVGHLGARLRLALNGYVIGARPQPFAGFGIFDLARGFGFVIANVIAGWWWRSSGPPAAFFSAATFATIAGIGLTFATRPRR